MTVALGLLLLSIEGWDGVGVVGLLVRDTVGGEGPPPHLRTLPGEKLISRRGHWFEDLMSLQFCSWLGLGRSQEWISGRSRG